MPHPTTINVDIEAIVREVIDRLGDASASTAPPASRKDSSRSDSSRRDLSGNGQSALTGTAPPPIPIGGVMVDARVVTAQLLGRHFAGQAVLVLRHDAIVTPAARDWLKERSVAVSTQANERNRQTSRAVVLSVDGRFDLDPWLRREPLAGCDPEILPGADLPRTVVELATRVAAGEHVGILISDQPHAAVCLANRGDGIRAVHAATPAAAADAVAEAAANLLVVKTSPELAAQFDQFITPLLNADSKRLAPSIQLR